MGMRGIIFDLDGVLCYTDHYHYLAWKAVADRLSLSFDEQVGNRLRGISRMESLEIILSLGNKTYSQKEKEQMAARRNRLYRSYLEYMGPEALALGIVGMLRTLRENDWKIGIGSPSKNASLILKRAKLDGFFDVVADGSQITKSEPDPEVFRLTARKLRLSPDEYAVAEGVSVGILATNADGFFPIGPRDVAQAPGCHAVLNALYELSELCRRLYSRVPKSKPSDSTPLSQGGGAVKKEERPPDWRYDDMETCRNVRKVTLSADKRVFAEVSPLQPWT